MRHVLGPVIRYPLRLARSLAELWNEFWYTPADPTLMGLLRILTGLMLLYTHAVWGLALDDFFGPSSWLNPELVRSLQRDQFAYSFWTWVPAGSAWLAHGSSLVILGLFTVGLWTSLTSVLALIVAISYAQRVPAALFGLDQINVMLTLYLTIGRAGQALSIDRWIAWQRGDDSSGPMPSVAANLGQRLIQVHMCVIYFFAGISKLQGPAWWSGEAMWLAFANLEYQSTDMTWLAWHPWLLNVITYTTVLWEMFFCVLIWKPLARPLILAAAVLLHLGIGLCLGMWTFGLIMLVGCASFLPNEAVRRCVAGLMHRRGAAVEEPGPIPASSSSDVPLAGTRGGPRSARSRGGRSFDLDRDRPALRSATGPRGEHGGRRDKVVELVPVFVVFTQTTSDAGPGVPWFADTGFGHAFEPLYVVVSFDETLGPLTDRGNDDQAAGRTLPACLSA